MSQIDLRVLEQEVMNNVSRSIALLGEIPFVLPFEQRVRLFYAFIDENRQICEEGSTLSNCFELALFKEFELFRRKERIRARAVLVVRKCFCG